MRRRGREGEEEKQLWEKEVWRERVKVPTILQTIQNRIIVISIVTFIILLNDHNRKFGGKGECGINTLQMFPTRTQFQGQHLRILYISGSERQLPRACANKETRAEKEKRRRHNRDPWKPKTLAKCVQL